jgi:hypothetical protein
MTLNTKVSELTVIQFVLMLVFINVILGLVAFFINLVLNRNRIL